MLSIFLFLVTTLATHNTLRANYLSDGRIFKITSFYNSGSPHSIEASICFFVSDGDPTTSFNNVYCFYSQSVQPSVATTSTDAPCNDSSVVFGFEYSSAANGYYLHIAHISNDNTTVDTGIVFMGDNVTTVVNELNPNGDFQMLVHDTDFWMGYNRVEDC